MGDDFDFFPLTQLDNDEGEPDTGRKQKAREYSKRYRERQKQTKNELTEKVVVKDDSPEAAIERDSSPTPKILIHAGCPAHWSMNTAGKNDPGFVEMCVIDCNDRFKR